MADVYFTIITLLTLYFLFLSAKNIKTLKTLNVSPIPPDSPKVSVCIPARNEEKNIGACLDSLVRQDYPDYEVLVIDDNSTDLTWEIMTVYLAKSPRVRIFRGDPLPQGWSGKQYACHQLSGQATGDILVFTDADTVYSPKGISWIVSSLRHHNADFMSGYLKHTIGSIGEAIVVPAMYLMTTLLMPLWLIPRKNHPLISFGIGQLLVCRKEAFRAIGGYENIRDSVVEDMAMAWLMKSKGFKSIFVDAKKYIQCRMYDSFASSFNGFVKNIYGAIHQNFLALIGLFTLIAGVIQLPLIHLIDLLFNKSGGNIFMAGLPVALFTLTWFRVTKDRRLPLYIGFLYPLIFINILAIAVFSYVKTGLGGGADWKGRLVKCRQRQHKTEDTG